MLASLSLATLVIPTINNLPTFTWSQVFEKFEISTVKTASILNSETSCKNKVSRILKVL